MDHPIPLNELPESLRKFCDPSGPPPGRMIAAKGLVPLKPADLLTVSYQLSFDQDEQIRAAAQERCTSLPENILDARVLDFFADKYFRKERIIQIILLNRATADETVAKCAKKSNENISEIIATNEQRLLRYPSIIENLYLNKSARMSTVNRAIELAVRNNIILDGIAAFKEAAAAIQGELIIEELGGTPLDQAFSETLEIGEALEAEEGPDAVEKELSEELPASEKRMSIQAELGQMSTSEKVRMALLGSAAHRSILVRDTNRLVAMAAIKSPQVRDTEAMAYCRNKSLHEEVIRYISDKKEWTKHYAVKLNLIENPKTPLPRALNFLSHLRQHDLRAVSRNKNVPAAIAKAARNQLKKRM
jgi:hypothetical protein